MFFEKVKARLRNKDTYQDFLKCLNLFSQEIIGRTELHSLVSVLPFWEGVPIDCCGACSHCVAGSLGSQYSSSDVCSLLYPLSLKSSSKALKLNL